MKIQKNNVTFCYACGTLKNMKNLEMYPVEDHPLFGKLQDPLLVVHIADKMAIVCHECDHKLDVDMWASVDEWAAVSKLVCYEDLPISPPHPMTDVVREKYAVDAYDSHSWELYNKLFKME